MALKVTTSTEAETTTVIKATISGETATDKAETRPRGLTGIGRWTDNLTKGTRYNIE